MNYGQQQLEHSRQFYRALLERGNLEAFTDPTNIWYWMHTSCMEPLAGLFQGLSPASFVTIGDGYCAREGNFVQRFGHTVCATDHETCLIETAGIGFSQQDMNALTFEDGSFDFAFVKESLHHSATPYVALAEMMRVSRRGVILIEPNGDNRAPLSSNGFEASGNYMFSFRSDELVQIGLAAGYKLFAFRYTMIFFGVHDYDAIIRGEGAQEKARLKALEARMPPRSKPLLCFLFLKEPGVLGLLDNSFTTINL